MYRHGILSQSLTLRRQCLITLPSLAHGYEGRCASPRAGLAVTVKSRGKDMRRSGVSAWRIQAERTRKIDSDSDQQPGSGF